MKMIVEFRELYGKKLAYPACDRSRILANLIGAKTFNDAQLDKIAALGIEIRDKRDWAIVRFSGSQVLEAVRPW